MSPKREGRGNSKLQETHPRYHFTPSHPVSSHYCVCSWIVRDQYQSITQSINLYPQPPPQPSRKVSTIHQLFIVLCVLSCHIRNPFILPRLESKNKRGNDEEGKRKKRGGRKKRKREKRGEGERRKEKEELKPMESIDRVWMEICILPSLYPSTPPFLDMHSAHHLPPFFPKRKKKTNFTPRRYFSSQTHSPPNQPNSASYSVPPSPHSSLARA